MMRWRLFALLFKLWWKKVERETKLFKVGAKVWQRALSAAAVCLCSAKQRRPNSFFLESCNSSAAFNLQRSFGSMVCFACNTKATQLRLAFKLLLLFRTEVFC